MEIMISGIPIDIQKKNIKNMHLQVKPPEGHVVISAPLSMDDKAIEVYARTNLSWIKKRLKSMSSSLGVRNDNMSVEKQCIYGENNIFCRLSRIQEKIVLNYKGIR